MKVIGKVSGERFIAEVTLTELNDVLERGWEQRVREVSVGQELDLTAPRRAVDRLAEASAKAHAAIEAFEQTRVAMRTFTKLVMERAIAESAAKDAGGAP